MTYFVVPGDTRRGDNGVFSSGYSSVIFPRKAYFPVSTRPLKNSASMKLPRKSFREKAGSTGAVTAFEAGLAIVLYSDYFQMFQGVCIQAPTTTSQTRVTGMKTFHPRRMIWSYR